MMKKDDYLNPAIDSNQSVIEPLGFFNTKTPEELLIIKASSEATSHLVSMNEFVTIFSKLFNVTRECIETTSFLRVQILAYFQDKYPLVTLSKTNLINLPDWYCSINFDLEKDFIFIYSELEKEDSFRIGSVFSEEYPGKVWPYADNFKGDSPDDEDGSLHFRKGIGFNKAFFCKCLLPDLAKNFSASEHEKSILKNGL